MAKKDSLIKNEKIIIAIILGLALIAYALISRQTKLDTLRIQREAEKEAQTKEEEKETYRTIRLNACLRQAEEDKWDRWSLNCEEHGFNIKRDGGEIESCSLPSYLADDILEEEQREKDRCAELYK